MSDTRRSTGEVKPKQEWDKLDNEGSEVNAWALYNIFNGLGSNEFSNEFCRITTCKCAKKA